MSDGLLESVIRSIAEKHAKPGDWPSAYGTDVDTPIFSMHTYCWCERENCPWCKEEDPEPNFHYKPKDIRVWWYKHIGRGMSVNKDVTADDCAEMLRECVK